MLSVSVIIPAWNEEERIAECLTCATRQTVAAKEILVVNNNSTDNTEAIVRKFIAQNPHCNVKILEQSDRQGLIPTRNFGFAHATGDIFGRIDADCMMDPHWVEVVTASFAHDRAVMGLTGPVTYYDMPARMVSLVGDNQIRKRVYKADGGKVLLFGSNMALRAKAWNAIKGEVCEDLADEIHEDIDISLHLIANGLKTAYNPKMIVGMSARRMGDSKSDFLTYMRRFRNTFEAHPGHIRTTRPEYVFTSLYPIMHLWYPAYRQQLEKKRVNPAKQVWLKKQMKLARRKQLESCSSYSRAKKEKN